MYSYSRYASFIEHGSLKEMILCPSGAYFNANWLFQLFYEIGDKFVPFLRF